MLTGQRWRYVVNYLKRFSWDGATNYKGNNETGGSMSSNFISCLFQDN